MTWAALQEEATARSLRILGAFHPGADDNLENVGTLVLLGPREPEFWQAVTTAPEWNTANPVDAWSKRVIGGWARDLDAAAFYPFSGPPWHPFLEWAKRTGRIHSSPVGMLVHNEVGLFVSFRGALGVRARMEIPEAAPSPCETCSGQPCRTACPVDALTGARYETDRCKAHLQQPFGQDCLSQGCRARRICPVSQGAGRSAEQSAYHMQRFLGV